MTEQKKRIAIGVVGASARTGWAMRAHMPALRALPEYDLAAVCTTKRDSAEEAQRAYGARKAYWDYREMVNDPDIELVDVSVKAPEHYPVVMAALDAGKHVFCEWPLGVDAHQADQMASRAQERGVHTLVGVQARYAPSFQHFRNLVQGGYLGTPLSATMTMFLPGLLRPRPQGATWNARRENGAHALNIATGHALDTFLWCLGDLAEAAPIVATQVPEWPIAGSENTVPVTSPDTVAFVGHLTNGAVVSVHVASVPWHGTALRIEAYGAGGALIASSDQMVEMVDPVLRGGRGDQRSLEVLTPPDSLRWVPADLQGVAVNVAQMFRRFARTLRAGEPTSPDFAEAARRQHLLDYLATASANRSWAKLHSWQAPTP